MADEEARTPAEPRNSVVQIDPPSPGSGPTEDSEERVTAALERILELSHGGPMPIRKIMEIMHGRGMQMVIILLCLPFLSPVSIPGLSIPFGLAIAFCGLRLAFGKKPWLPGLILNREIPHKMLAAMVRIGCKVYRGIEKAIKPRMLWVFEDGLMKVLLGLGIMTCGICLSLPLPPFLPLTNTIPGLAIILFCLGLIERDGLLILVGWAFTVLALAYFSTIAILGVEGIKQVWQWLTGG